MSSDSSFPHPPNRRGQAQPVTEPRGARVLEFPTDEVSSPGQPVPAGTWASVEDEPEAARSSERPLRVLRERDVAQVVAFPRHPSTHRRKRVQTPDISDVRESSGAQRTQAPTPELRGGGEIVERPAYLASELLRQDWFPRTPLCRSLRWGAIGVGAAGAIGVLAFGGAASGALLLAGLLAACAVAGALPISPQTRGVALAILGVTGTIAAGWMRMADGHEPAALFLVGCVTVSSSALFFRGAHRTSRFARTLVGVGLASTACWLVLTGGIGALVIETLAWQDWIFPASRLVLAFIVLGALLTFLDPTGHGGAWIAGTAFIAWLALDVMASMAIAAWPARGASTIELGHAEWLATLAFPFLAALSAGGLCQVWVLVSRAPAGRREMPSRATMA